MAVSRFELPAAVVPAGWPSLQTDFLHAQLVGALVRQGGLVVVERSRLDTILSEQDLVGKAVVDADAAARIGRLLGVRYFVLGSISDVGLYHGTEAIPYSRHIERVGQGRIRADVRIVDVESGAIVGAESHETIVEMRGLAPEHRDTGDLSAELSSRFVDEVARHVASVVVPGAVMPAPVPLVVEAPRDPLESAW